MRKEKGENIKFFLYSISIIIKYLTIITKHMLKYQK